MRLGGPSIGFEPVSSQMYKDTSITLGQVSTDEAIRFSDGQPTQAVVAPMEGTVVKVAVGDGPSPALSEPDDWALWSDPATVDARSTSSRRREE